KDLTNKKQESVKGYQDCNFTVDVGEEFFIFKKIGSKGRAFKVTNTKGQLGHLERTLVLTLWPFKDGMKWRFRFFFKLHFYSLQRLENRHLVEPVLPDETTPTMKGRVSQNWTSEEVPASYSTAK
ncbi:unnamed protein product, partial [Porites lobata]